MQKDRQRYKDDYVVLSREGSISDKFVAYSHPVYKY